MRRAFASAIHPASFRTTEGWTPVVFWVASGVYGAVSALSRSDRKSTRLNSSHGYISYAGLCLRKKRVGQIGAVHNRQPPGPAAALRRAEGAARAPAEREDQSADTRPQDRMDPDLFFNDTATTEIYTLSLHDALPI